MTCKAHNSQSLRHIIDIRSVGSQTADGQGGYVSTPSLVVSSFAEVLPVSGKEMYFAEKLSIIASHTVLMRYSPLVTAGNTLLWGARLKSTVPTLMLNATVSIEPHSTIFKEVFDGRKFGDIDNSGTFTSGDAAFVIAFLAGNKTYADYIENVFTRKMATNPVKYAAYIDGIDMQIRYVKNIENASKWMMLYCDSGVTI